MQYAANLWDNQSCHINRWTFIWAFQLNLCYCCKGHLHTFVAMFEINRSGIHWELFYSFLGTIHVIICINSRLTISPATINCVIFTLMRSDHLIMIFYISGVKVLSSEINYCILMSEQKLVIEVSNTSNLTIKVGNIIIFVGKI